MQNSLQQLDLFGFPIEAAAPPKKKEKVVVKSVPVQQSITESTEPAIVEEVVVAEETITITQTIAEVIKETLPKLVSVSKPSSLVKNTDTKQLGKRGRKSFKEMDNEADLIEVPEDEVLQKKLYYTISEVAGWFKVNTSLLRYWENEFDILQPRKTRKGDRLFRVEDIKNLQLIYFLLRQRKFSIDGAKNYLKNNKQEADTQVRLVESLNKFKSFLLELKANLQQA